MSSFKSVSTISNTHHTPITATIGRNSKELCRCGTEGHFQFKRDATVVNLLRPAALQSVVSNTESEASNRKDGTDFVDDQVLKCDIKSQKADHVKNFGAQCIATTLTLNLQRLGWKHLKSKQSVSSLRKSDTPLKRRANGKHSPNNNRVAVDDIIQELLKSNRTFEHYLLNNPARSSSRTRNGSNAKYCSTSRMSTNEQKIGEIISGYSKLTKNASK